MVFAVHGGIHPDSSKHATAHKPIETLDAPEYLILPLSMNIGAPCVPSVAVGQEVKMGQIIADSESPVSAPIHAPVSGKVSAIEPRPHPNGSKIMSIVIENDGLDTPDEMIRPQGSYPSLTPEQLLKIIRDCGIVGLGGAAFPTHTKIRSGIGKINTLIINGAECEPYITSDYRLMLEAAEEIVGGVGVLMKILGIDKCIIAVESNKRDAIENLKKILPKKSCGITVRRLPTRYPQGAEKQLILTIAAREVPPGQLPASVGAAVFNVSTATAIHRAVTGGRPLINRVITVSGSAVSNAKNLLVRIGTPMKEVFEATGGFRETPYKVIMGGPMMGIAQHDLMSPIIKGCSSLLAFAKTDVHNSAEQSCIRCGKCAGACPMRLLPSYMYMYERKDRLDMLDKLRLQDCMECGSCSYTCPAKLHLVHSFRAGKTRLAEYRKKAAAGR